MALAALAVILPGVTQALAAAALPDSLDAGSDLRTGSAAAAACEAAILRAEGQYGLPRGLLFAIGLAESGRADPATGRARPWPWAVQAGERSLYFETKNAAVEWVQAARGKGAASIDTGCLQVNLMFHPDAFASIEAAFDPERNVDYAARFLVRLHAETNDWPQAIGFYHSRTPALALPYQQHVQVTMGLRPTGPTGAMPALAPPQPPSLAVQLARAWAATSPPAAPAAPRLAGTAWSILLRLHPPAPLSRVAAAPPARRLITAQVDSVP